MSAPERLTASALIRDGEIHSRGFKEHWQIRAALGDADPYRKSPADQYGFMTSEGRFVTRSEAMAIGEKSGQCVRMGRELLSSDVNWGAEAAAGQRPRGVIVGASMAGAAIAMACDMIGDFPSPAQPGEAAQRAKARDAQRHADAKAAATSNETRQQRRARERRSAKRA